MRVIAVVLLVAIVLSVLISVVAYFAISNSQPEVYAHFQQKGIKIKDALFKLVVPSESKMLNPFVFADKNLKEKLTDVSDALNKSVIIVNNQKTVSITGKADAPYVDAFENNKRVSPSKDNNESLAPNKIEQPLKYKESTPAPKKVTPTPEEETPEKPVYIYQSEDIDYSYTPEIPDVHKLEELIDPLNSDDIEEWKDGGYYVENDGRVWEWPGRKIYNSRYI